MEKDIKFFKKSFLALISKTILFIFFTFSFIFSNAQSISICEGNTDILVNPNPGGTWFSSDPSICTVDINTGEIIAIAEGSCTISYTDLFLIVTNFSISVNGIVVLEPITGASSVCVGSSIVLSTLSSGGFWSTSDALTLSSDGTGLVNGINSGNAIISYTKTNGSCQTIETYSITVYGLPIITPISEFTDVCVGSTSSFINSTANGIWSTSNNVIATVDLDGFLLGIAYGTVTVSYTVTENGCVNFVDETINVIPPSTLEMTSIVESDSQIVCLTNSIEDITYSLGGSGSNVHIISGSFPIGVTGTYSAGVYTVSGTPTQTGVFIITIETYGSLCDFEVSKTIYIKVNQPPIIDFTYVINGLDVIFTNTTVDSDLSYVWDFGSGSSSSTLVNPIYTYSALGSYTVSLTSQNNCGSASNSHIIGVDGLENLNLIEFKMFPNPFSDEIKLEFKSTEKSEIIITDLAGKIILNKEFNQDSITLNLEELIKGQYLLVIKQNSKIQIEKIIKR